MGESLVACPGTTTGGQGPKRLTFSPPDALTVTVTVAVTAPVPLPLLKHRGGQGKRTYRSRHQRIIGTRVGRHRGTRILSPLPRRARRPA